MISGKKMNLDQQYVDICCPIFHYTIDNVENNYFYIFFNMQWRLDYNSRPRGTSGVIDRFWHTGLRNLGNSCFLNAVVQCILACQPLQQNFGSHGTERAVAQMHGRCGAAAPERGVGLHSSVVFASSDVPH